MISARDTRAYKKIHTHVLRTHSRDTQICQLLSFIRVCIPCSIYHATNTDNRRRHSLIAPTLKMKGLTSLGVLLLLFLGNTTQVAASPSVFVVDGIHIYEERSDPRLHYELITPLPSWPNLRANFLYTEIDHPDTWTLGNGDDLSTVKPSYPTTTCWEGEDFPRELEVIEVKNIDAHELKKIMDGEEDVIVKGNRENIHPERNV